MYTKRYFEELARTIKSIKGEGLQKRTMKQWARVFEKHNPRFDRKRFFQACGIKKERKGVYGTIYIEDMDSKIFA